MKLSYCLITKITIISVLSAIFLNGISYSTSIRIKKNILLITLDTTRQDHLSVYGYKEDTTPNLKQLAKTSFVFQNAYTTVPLTLPSHATILTGKYPPGNTVRNNMLFSLPSSEISIAKILKNYGYNTAAYVSASILDKRGGLNQGFDVYDDKMIMTPPGGTIPDEKSASQVTSQAIDELKRIKKPFFLWIHYYDPHKEYRPPEPFSRKFKNPYDGEIAYLDSEIGKMLKHVDMKNTIIIIAGDHGEMLGEHGEKEHGVFLYEASMKVPLIVYIPESNKGGSIGALCNLIDIAPTILEYAGININHKIDGESLLPIINKSKKMQHEMVYMESLYPYLAFAWFPLRAVFDGRIKYILAPKEELYDIKNDPGEQHNIFNKNKDKLTQLKAYIKRFPDPVEGTREYLKKAYQDVNNRKRLSELMALGYIAGDAGLLAEKDLLDPKDVIDISEKMDIAKEEVGLNQYDKAEEILKGVIKRNPKNVPALSLLGSVYLNQNELEKALVCFKETVKANPYFEDVHLNMGVAYRKMGKLEDAEASFKRSLELNPDFVESITNLATLYLDTGKNKMAEDLILSALKRDLKSSDLYYEAGIIYVMKNELEEAKRSFLKSLSLNPVSAKTCANIGHIAYQQKRIDEAVIYYEKAVRFDTKNVSYLTTLGSIYLYEKEDSKNAIKYYRRALSVDPYGKEANNLKELIMALEQSE